MKRRKGELASQIFIYILGIMTVGLLLLVGIKAVDTLEKNQCKVRETQFVTQLATAIEKDKGWGVSRIEEFQLPCEAQAVCLVDRTFVDAASSAPLDPAIAAQYVASGYGTIITSVESGVKVNVFLKMSDGTFNPVSRFEIAAPIIGSSPTTPITCIGGEPTRIRFNGQGTGVTVVPADT